MKTIRKVPQTQPPEVGATFEYLATASPAMLQNFELIRLNERANLKKHLVETIERMVNVTAEAILARTLMEQRKKTGRPVNRSNPPTPADLLAELLVPEKRLTR